MSITEARNKHYETTYQKVNAPVAIDEVSNKDYVYLRKNGYMFNDILLNQNPDYLVASFTDPKNEKNYYTWLHFGSTLDQMKTLSDNDFEDGTKIPFEFLWFNYKIVAQNEFYLYQVSINANFSQYITDLKNIKSTNGPLSLRHQVIL